MTVSDVGQAKVFLIYILFGMLCIMLFDLFWVIQQKYGKNTVLVNVIDAIYFVTAFILVLYAGIKYNFGAFRYYQIMGLMAGLTFQYAVFSKAERKIFGFIIKSVEWSIKFVLKMVKKPSLFILRIIFTPIMHAEKIVMRTARKYKKWHSKVKKRRKNNKKNLKKQRKMI